jgi:cytochrome c
MRPLLRLLPLLLGGCLGEGEPPSHLAVPGADPARGQALMREHGCGACHRIPGVRQARAMVGPPLDDYALRGYVAGVLPNRPANLIAWLRDPPAITPATAMPNLGLTEQEARDMAAYLYTLGARRATVYPPGVQPHRAAGPGRIAGPPPAPP